jgi:hypothetical protein
VGDDQRYCLQCGTRRGDPRVDYLHELGLERPPVVLAEVVAVRSGAARPSRALTIALAAVTLGVGSAAGALLHGAEPSAAAGALIALDEPVTAASGGVTAAAMSAPTASRTPAATGTPTPAATGTPTAGSPGTPTAAPTPSSTDAPGSASPTPAASTSTLPSIGHVWVISLTGQDARTAFAATSGSTYLSRDLPAQGALLSGYAPVGASALANDIALLSGQPPNPDTEANCPTATDVTPGTIDAATGLVNGSGCIYPAATQTLAGQLTNAGRSWRTYVEGLANPCEPPAAPTTAPAVPGPTAGSDPPAVTAPATATARDPFPHFRALLDANGSGCVPGAVELGALAGDLAAPPTLSWIVPGGCWDGADVPCAEGAAAGLTALEPWLRVVVTTITATAAYQRDGLIAITFDAGPPPAPGAATSEPPAPLGALLLSPYVRPGAKVTAATDPYDLLRTLEDLLALPHLGHAADPTRTSLGSDVFRAPRTTPTTRLTTTTTRHGGRFAAVQSVP